MNQTDILEDWFRKQLGTKENPPGSNCVWYNTLYWGRQVQGKDYAWCVVFQWCAFHFAGMSRLLYDGQKVCRCKDLKKWAQKKGIWVTSDFRRGDLVLMNKDGGSTPKHVGWVDEVKGEYCYCFEGNTSITSLNNGGQVMRMPRHIKYIVGAVRIQYEDYEDEDMDISKLTPEQIEELRERLFPGRYYSVEDMPKYYQEEAQGLIDRGALKGRTDGGLDLSEDMLRVLIICQRMLDEKEK